MPEEKATKEKKQTFKNLLSPTKLGPVELKNSISLAPMNETFSGHNGEATEQMTAYFAARAKGGAGLVSTGAIMGTRLGSQFVWGRNLYCFHHGHLQGLVMLTDNIHYFGSKAAAQMTIGFGRQGHSYDHTLLAPAPTAGLPYELTMDKAPNHVAEIWKEAEHPKAFLVGQMTRDLTLSRSMPLTGIWNTSFYHHSATKGRTCTAGNGETVNGSSMKSWSSFAMPAPALPLACE